MEQALQDAIQQLRASAAEHGYPLDHLTDAEIVEGVGIVSRQLSDEGYAVPLMSAGIEKVGRAFVDLQRAGYVIAEYRFA